MIGPLCTLPAQRQFGGKMIGRHPVHDRCQHAHRSRPHVKFRPVAQPRAVVRPLLRQQQRGLHTAVVQRPLQARPCRRFDRHLHHHESVAELLRPHPRPQIPASVYGSRLSRGHVVRPPITLLKRGRCRLRAWCTSFAISGSGRSPSFTAIFAMQSRVAYAIPAAFRARGRPSSRSRPPVRQCRAASVAEGHRASPIVALTKKKRRLRLPATLNAYCSP